MRKKRRKSRHDETMRPNAVISIVSPRMSFNVKGEKDFEPEIEGRPWLELRGKLTEPIRDVHDVVFKLWPDQHFRVGPARPVSVGYLTNVRPHVEIIASCPFASFDYTWSLALSGKLTHAYMSLTKPHYNSASVLHMSFSNELEE